VFLFAVAVVLIRPIAFFVSLVGTQLDFRSRLLIAWFGPRGLSSLLLILLPVFAAVPGTQLLFAICCFIVLLSVVLHGGSLMFLGRESAARPPETAATLAANGIATELAATSASVEGDGTEGVRITIPEMRELQQSGAPSLVLDVRADRSFADSELVAQGTVRIPADRAVERLTELNVPRQTWLFAFCA
jgi:sodium/hydrogen antiporter